MFSSLELFRYLFLQKAVLLCCSRDFHMSTYKIIEADHGTPGVISLPISRRPRGLVMPVKVQDLLIKKRLTINLDVTKTTRC